MHLFKFELQPIYKIKRIYVIYKRFAKIGDHNPGALSGNTYTLYVIRLRKP